MAGLQAIDADAALEQAVAVLLLDAVIAILGNREVMVVLREIADEMLGKGRQILRAHHMAIFRKAGRVHEMAMVQTQLFGFVIHILNECTFGAGEIFRHYDAGVIARLDDDAVDELFHRYLRADAHTGLRALRAPCFFTDGEFIVELYLAFFQALEQQIDRHQLAHRRWRHRLLTHLVQEHGMGVHVDHIGVGSRGFHRRKSRGCGTGNKTKSNEKMAGQRHQ